MARWHRWFACLAGLGVCVAVLSAQDRQRSGAEITDTPIDFVQGKEVTGIEVVISRGRVRR